MSNTVDARVIDTVYHARFVSEDTNPWDSNESYGVHLTLEKAQKVFEETFTSFEEEEYKWVRVRDTYSGVGMLPTWRRFDVTEEIAGLTDEELGWEDDGYGFYVFEEHLR